MNDLGFSFHATREGSVRISRGGRVVVVLRGEVAARFLAKAQSADPETIQQLCARVTGNYKRGNEGTAREKEARRRARP